MKKTTTTTTTTTTVETSGSDVEIIFVLDRSGSMSGMTEEVIGSFNHFINEQKKEEGNAFVTLVIFDNQIETVYKHIDINEVPKLDSSTYFARGMTSMYDGIGTAITGVAAENAMVLINTDGYENSSKEYSGKQIGELIKKREAQGWDFIFLGADIDTSAEAQKFGMDTSKSFAYDKSADGINVAFTNMSNATALYRSMKLGESDITLTNKAS